MRVSSANGRQRKPATVERSESQRKESGLPLTGVMRIATC